ncbi:MAG: YIP1 family protein [Nanoarchaeota archaeon]
MAQGIIRRARTALLSPRKAIEATTYETLTIHDAVTYLAILAGFRALSGLIGYGLFGETPFHLAFISELVGIILILGAALGLAFILRHLSGHNHTTSQDMRGLKLSLLAFTPFLVAGLLRAIPFVYFLQFAALILSGYILMRGMGTIVTVKEHERKRSGILAIVAMIILVAIISAIQITIRSGTAIGSL